MTHDRVERNMIGAYGTWAAGSVLPDPPQLSLRTGRYRDIDRWRTQARERVSELLCMPHSGGIPQATVDREYAHDGLHVEELSWQLPYGPPTQAILLKPENTTGSLPGVIALHDHGGHKFFGKRKITRTSDDQHPLMREHQANHYGDRGWANEIAKRGYVVLVHDAFPFASRRVRPADVDPVVRGATKNVSKDENDAEIVAYNTWAAQHEHVMAKSLFYAGTTWPGVFLAEDQRALDYLCSRDDVDADHVGCCGLSGGGMRTICLGGMDDRIKAAVCVGLMSTNRDYGLNKCWTHTWMMCVPGLARELDYPELFALRAPLPTMVLNDDEDQLFSLPEMHRADRIVQEVFDIAGAGDRYQCSFYPGPHKFDRDMQEEAFEWIDRWLSASPSCKSGVCDDSR